MFSVGEDVHWHNKGNHCYYYGKLVAQPFPDLPHIWLIRQYYTSELVLVEEENLAYSISLDEIMEV